MLDNIIARLYCEIHRYCDGCIYEKTRDKCEPVILNSNELKQECIDILMMIRNTDDCISREKAKQFLYEGLERLNDDELYDIFSRIIDDMYNELPSVIPQNSR